MAVVRENSIKRPGDAGRGYAAIYRMHAAWCLQPRRLGIESARLYTPRKTQLSPTLTGLKRIHSQSVCNLKCVNTAFIAFSCYVCVCCKNLKVLCKSVTQTEKLWCAVRTEAPDPKINSRRLCISLMLQQPRILRMKNPANSLLSDC